MSHFSSGARNNAKSLSSISQSGFSVLTAGLLIIIIALAGASGFIYLKSQERIDLLERKFMHVEGRLLAKTDTTNAFKVELAKVSTDVSTQDALVQIHLKSLDTTLDKMSVRVNKLEDSSSQEWLLSEIEYLMKMADHRMLMKDDVKGAIALLKSADAVISNMPVKDAGLNKVRVAIAEDITALELYEAIDVPGIYAELVALAGLVEKLPMVPLEQEEVEEASADVSTDEVSLLDKINSSMGQYLTVRRYNDTELEKMLTRDQRNFVKGSMLLSLEQAQTAVLRSDQSIYDDNLNAVRATLISYFKSGSYQVDIAKLKLNKLIGVKIEAELPAISGSQQAINRYISEKVRTR